MTDMCHEVWEEQNYVIDVDEQGFPVLPTKNLFD